MNLPFRLFIFASIYCAFINAYGEQEQELHRDIKKRQASSIALNVKDCGTRKSCYISPNDCDRNEAKCNYVLKWDYDGNLINYELKGVTSGWISVVFSDDRRVGNDNVVVCMREDGTKNVIIYHYYKNGSDSNELLRLPLNQDGLEKKEGYYDAGVMFCKFSRPKITDLPYVNNLNKGHYIHVGRGSKDEQINDNLIKKFQPTDNPVEFYTITKIYEPTSWLVKIHATLMIIAWIFFASLGVLIARYYKPMWPNHAMFNTRIWFAFHQPIMLGVLIMTLFGFLFILIEKNFLWSTHDRELTHSILGIIVICCVIVNPILGFLRPRPDSRLRCLFFWIHWLIGTVAYCLAVPAIFIGMDLRKIDLPNWCGWLLFAWVIFHIIVEIILEVHYCCTFHKQDQRVSEFLINDKNVIVVKQNNPPGYRWKPTLLIIYAAITAIVVIAIVLTIILRDIFV